ncbi:MAG TPA: chemotaxis protein CheW [Gammaproteobacteria bacterium]
MSESAEQVKCVLLTINEDRLLLPNTALAEIVQIRNIINVANKPNWMLGYLDWRGNSVPLVAFETIGGVRMPSLASGQVKAAVFYAIGDDKKFPFISILVQGAPQVVNVLENDLIESKEEIKHPALEQKVMVKGELASIVDLEKLEAIVKKIMT